MISNSSPLIVFGRLNKIDLLLKIFKEVSIPQAVYKEVVENGLKSRSPDALLLKENIEQGLIKVKKLNNEYEKKALRLTKIYNQLDKGEAETIALALQEKEQEILMDEDIGRKIAKLYNLKPRGSLRVLLLSFKNNLLSEDEIKELIKEMTASKLRLSPEVINEFWDLFKKIKK